MFYILSKILYYLILPYSWIVILLALSFVLRKDQVKKRFRRLSIVLIYVFSIPWFSNIALRLIETDPIEIEGTFEIGVVLGGMLSANDDPHDQFQFNDSPERLLEAIRLYNAQKVGTILITTGAGDIQNKQFNEGDLLEQLALEIGVLREDLIVENASRNTYENALYTSNLLKENREILLITSAFHMKRAAACFRNQGFDVTEYPVDFRAIETFKITDLIPQSDAFQNWNIVIKELVGLTMYKMMGYI
jgi:uncharacterized SAM-binding protein YcdF (DUF218 family)